MLGIFWQWNHGNVTTAYPPSEYLDLFKAGIFTIERASVVSFKGPNCVVLSTGTEVEADTIVCATGKGYIPMFIPRWAEQRCIDAL